MRSTMTAVLERNTVVREDFRTEPYELPWAGEARFFVQALELTGSVEFRTEISPDGLHWCPLDDNRHRVDAAGLTSWPVTGFGQWLRLSCEVAPGAVAKVRIYLVGKG
ncbi:hypothetical protein FPZ12_030965 [Amycolatopsis acidicola]|uniref:Uncharacterized protein n=1 Tax=Amycolatopsis acidicola TaxID=2596893 RepID=A0A5N0UU69_9PSEU|nr:hypothetical protein [Amycolatopsis acidicola]KAA9154947.1 hypothetical protein FPZ12_030965 [Amycolatopsis acidicola]